MKKKIAIFCVLFMSILQIFPDVTEDYSMIRDNFYPCDESSINETKLLIFLENFCIKEGIKSFSKVKIEDENEITNSYNFEIRIEGKKKTDQDIVVLCPLNSQIIKQELYDNSLSINIMLDLIDRCIKDNNDKNIVFLFSGANGREKNYEFYGLKNYISQKKDFKKSYFLILDLFSIDSNIRFTGSINKKPVPSQILNRFFHADKKNINIFFDNNEIIKSRLNMIEENDFVTYLLSNNINAFSFTNRNTNISNIFYFNKEFEKNLAVYFSEWISFMDGNDFPLDADYNYSLISFLKYHFIIPEFDIISIILFLIFLSIFLRLFLPHLQRLRMTLLLKTLPYFLFLFSVFYLLSYIPYLIFIPVEYISGIKKIYLNFQVLYFFNIFFVPLLVIFVMYEYLNKLPFPKHNYIYIFGAIIISFINLIFFLIFDISLVYIFLWVLILITLSNFTGKNILLKFIIYFLTPLPLIKLFIDLSITNISLINSSFSIPLLQHLVFCFVTFPFLLLMMRIRLITRFRYKIIINKYTYLFISAGILLASIVFLLIISIKIFPGSPVIYAKLFTNKNTNTLILDSNLRIGKIGIRNAGKYISYNINSDSKEIKIDYNMPPYTLVYSIIKKENNMLNLNISSSREIEYLKIDLFTPISFNPLDSNYPFSNISQLNNNKDKEEIYEFKIPRNPGNNFNLNVFLIPDVKYRMYIEINYPFINKNIVDIIKSDGFVYKNSTFIENIEF
jgi:hypothetical protein